MHRTLLREMAIHLATTWFTEVLAISNLNLISGKDLLFCSISLYFCKPFNFLLYPARPIGFRFLNLLFLT